MSVSKVVRLTSTALLVAAGLCACSPSRTPRSAIDFPQPVQAPLPFALETVILPDGRWLEPKWYYSVDAYVLGANDGERDLLSEVAAQDLVLAWGPAAKPHSVPHISVSQANRAFTWKASDELIRNIGPRALLLSMANTVVIGATEDIQRVLKSARPGDALRAQGYLVDLKTRESTVSFRTSIKRDDTGPGSSEVFYATSAELLDPGY